MFRSIFAKWLETIIGVISAFILYPFFVKTLGDTQYGVWLLINSLLYYLNLLKLGVPLSNVRFISKYRALNDYNKVNEVLNTTLILYSFIGLLILIIGLLFSFFLPILFKISEKYIFISKVAFTIVIVIHSFIFPLEILNGLMHAYQKFVALSIIGAGLVILKIIMILFFLTNENGLIKVALIISIITLLEPLMFYLYIQKIEKRLKLRFRYFKLSMLKEIFSYSVYAIIIQVSSQIAFQTDSIVIGSIISTAAIVYYSIAMNFINYLTKFIWSIASVLMPKISDLDTRKQYDSIKYIYIEASKLTYLIVLPISLLLITLGWDFVKIWMGEVYANKSIDVLYILLASFPLYLVQGGVGLPLLMGVSKLKIPSIFMLSAALLNLIISIILGKIYGLNGVALGTTIPNFLLTAFFIWYITKLYKINLFYYVRKAIIIPSFSSVFFIVPVIILKQFWSIDNYFHFFLISILLLTIYSIVAITFFIGKDNRLKIILSLRKLISY